MPSPSPRLPPVTTMFAHCAQALMPHHFSRRRYRPGSRQNVWQPVLCAAGAAAARRRIARLSSSARSQISLDVSSQNHVGDDDGAGNRVLSTAHHRHADIGMAIDNRFDLLRVNLQSSYVDDPAPASDEMVPIAAQLDDIAGIEKAILIQQRLLRLARYRDAVPGDRIRSEPSMTFICTGRGRSPTRLAGKPSRPSFTSKPTPASVDA